MGWNRSTEKEEGTGNREQGKRKGFLFSAKGVIAGCALLALVFAALCFYASYPGPSRPEGAGVKKPKLIKAHEPAKISATNVQAKAKARPETNMDLRNWPVDRTNELSAVELSYWKMFNPIVPPEKNPPKANFSKYHIFRDRTDNEIASVVGLEPGTRIVVKRKFGPDFTDRFLKSIQHPIIVGKDDDDYTKTLKRAVIDAKIELKARYDNGEDICKIMQDASDELQRLGRYKATLEGDALRALPKDPSPEEVTAVMGVVNGALEKKGIAPIELNSVSRLSMMLRKAKNNKEGSK